MAASPHATQSAIGPAEARQAADLRRCLLVTSHGDGDSDRDDLRVPTGRDHHSVMPLLYSYQPRQDARRGGRFRAARGGVRV